MVICLRKKKELFLKILIFLLLIVFIYSFGYFCSFIKYDDEEFVEKKVLLEENKRLTSELEKIDDINIKYEKYIIGKVLYRDIHSFYDEIVINLGNKDVEVGDAVVNNEGLVGIVYKTDKYLSYVKLLTSEYNISVKINNTYGNLSNGIISLLDKYSDTKEGDLVYTSGFGETTEDIYVGKVKSVTYDSDGLGKEVKVDIINNRNLNYIGVIKKIK